jgi:NADPH-dependent 2,4-dienoyl-CoA reductase/sulfur reductase-like enzyme
MFRALLQRSVGKPRPHLTHSSLVLNFSTARPSHPRAMSTQRVVVIGGGCAGQAVSHQLLRRKGKDLDLSIVEPAETHYYQPGWTMVGGGIFKREDTAKPMADVMPSDATWLKNGVAKIDPDANKVELDDGSQISYDYLVVAPGITTKWDGIKGLEDALADPQHPVASNYSFEYCSKTASLIDEFKGGKAVFTQPTTGIKCGGAPQKIMYLAEAKWSDAGIRDQVDIEFFTGTPSNFAAPLFAAKLREICASKNLPINLLSNLKEIRKATNEAVFSITEDGKEVDERIVKYDFMHVTPPMGAPDIISQSPLAAEATGFCEVDKSTLQHVRYPNVFSLGDASSLPTSKTAAAISGQTKVLCNNILKEMGDESIDTDKYDGYTACPIPTGHGKLLLAEFDYDLQPQATFFSGSPDVEREVYFYMKRDMMPPLYWNALIKGTWLGPSTVPTGFVKNRLGFY